MNSLLSMIVVGALVAQANTGHGTALSESARTGIDAGNQAWIEGVKTGDVARIMATYTEEAVDCDPKGECTTGRDRIEQLMAAHLAELGHAHSASVQSWGSIEQGNFVYEWGQAEATFDGGKKLVDKYLTVWERQSDGGWKIFRNMVIPEK